MPNINTQLYKSPFGYLILGSYNSQLCLCDWQYRRMRTTIDKRIQTVLKAEYSEQTCDILDATKQQLQEYFEGQRQTFDLPIKMAGTAFQQTVWSALLTLPYGSTVSYSALAEKIDNKAAVRAVASANGANAMSIIIPCHRVIGHNGELTGYAGGLPVKKKLLSLENPSFNT